MPLVALKMRSMCMLHCGLIKLNYNPFTVVLPCSLCAAAEHCTPCEVPAAFPNIRASEGMYSGVWN